MTTLVILGMLAGAGWAIAMTVGIRSNAAVYSKVLFPLLGAIIGGFAGFIIGTIAESFSPRYKLRRPRSVKSDG